MYEVVMNGELVKKYFTCYATWDGENKDFESLLMANTLEMEEYLKYITRHYDDTMIYKTKFVSNNNFNEINQKYNLEEEPVWDDEILIFEFQDEETAFYFKLKFF